MGIIGDRVIVDLEDYEMQIVDSLLLIGLNKGEIQSSETLITNYLFANQYLSSLNL